MHNRIKPTYTGEKQNQHQCASREICGFHYVNNKSVLVLDHNAVNFSRCCISHSKCCTLSFYLSVTAVKHFLLYRASHSNAKLKQSEREIAETGESLFLFLAQ